MHPNLLGKKQPCCGRACQMHHHSYSPNHDNYYLIKETVYYMHRKIIDNSTNLAISEAPTSLIRSPKPLPI